MADPLDLATSVARGDRLEIRQWNAAGSSLDVREVTTDQLAALLVQWMALHPDVIERVQKTLSGTGAPSASLGIEEDSYVDLASGETYRRESGVWVAKGKIGWNPLGSYNAATNSPTLTSSGGGGSKGDIYLVSHAGTVAVDGVGAVAPPDQILNTGTLWVRVATSSLLGSMAAEDADAPTIAGEAISTDRRYLFTDVVIDAAGAVSEARDEAGGRHFGDATAETLRVRTDPTDSMDVVTLAYFNENAGGGSQTGGEVITASDRRYLFDDVILDAAGQVSEARGPDGRRHLGDATAETLRVLTAPTSGTDVVTKAYFDENATTGGSSYLEPSTYAEAPTDGVTDASDEVETTIVAVLALDGRESRKMAVDHDYQVGSLTTDNIGDIIPVGDGSLVGNNQYKTVIPADAPPLPPPRRSLVVRRDLPTYAAAVRANAGPITVVITGDSTSGRNVAGMNFASSPYSTITRYLQAAAPGVVFNFVFMGIGGTTMHELDTVPVFQPTPGGATVPVWYDPDTETPWLDVIAAANPVLVVVHGGRNQNDDFAVATAKSIADKIVAMGADCLFINSYGEVPITDDTARNKRLAAGGFLHSFATTYGPGVGGIDTLGYENLARFGWDPFNLAPMRSGGWFADGVMPTILTDLPLPYTCPTAAHAWSFSCRINPGKWTTMGDELWFQIGYEANDDCKGQRLELRRTGANMIEWRIMITSTAAGASGDYDFTAWTETGITVTDSDLVKFDISQMGNHIVLNWRDGGSPTSLADLSYSPVDILVPRSGGAYQMTIGCAAGSVTGCVQMSTGTDGKSSGALAVPIPQQLYMPTLTGAEFAPMDNETFALWGGNGPHPSALVYQFVTFPVFEAQDWSAW